MKIELVVMAFLAALAINCGGEAISPQDPSSAVPAVTADADAGATPAPAQPTK